MRNIDGALCASPPWWPAEGKICCSSDTNLSIVVLSVLALLASV